MHACVLQLIHRLFMGLSRGAKGARARPMGLREKQSDQHVLS